MATNHIDQLTQWYADAEQVTKDNLPNKGDVIIFPAPSFPGYITETVPVAWPSHLVAAPREHVRILDRAPKPAWHDAPAVTAKGREDWDHVEAFSRNDDYDPPRWIDSQGIAYTAEQLSDVTPLIEAKVTDAMIDRILDVIGARFDNYPAGIGEELAVAALGLETE